MLLPEALALNAYGTSATLAAGFWHRTSSSTSKPRVARSSLAEPLLIRKRPLVGSETLLAAGRRSLIARPASLLTM